MLDCDKTYGAIDKRLYAPFVGATMHERAIACMCGCVNVCAYVGVSHMYIPNNLDIVIYNRP